MNLYYLTPLILQKIIWIQTRLILNFFLRLKVEGLDNLKDIPKNAIFASNHVSELDPIIIPASLPFFSRFSPMFYATLPTSEYTNSSWRQIFYGGTLFKLWGGHLVYIGLKNYAKSLVNHIKLLKDGKSIVVFPEGQITPNGFLQPARGGVAYLAEVSGCPIVPVSISGVYGISNKEFFLRKRWVRICFGKPVYSVDIKGVDYKTKASFVYEKIKQLST